MGINWPERLEKAVEKSIELDDCLVHAMHVAEECYKHTVRKYRPQLAKMWEFKNGNNN